MDAPAAGDSGRGTVTEAVAAAASAEAAAVVVGCVGLLLFEHATAIRHTAAAAASWKRRCNMFSQLEHESLARRRWERHHHDVRPFLDAARPIVPRVACSDEEADLLSGCRLIAGHRRPADGIEVPVHGVLTHWTAVLIEPAPV